MAKYPHPCTIVVECKDAESGRWCEFDFFEVPSGLAGKHMRQEMKERYGASYARYRTNKKRGTQDFYFESDVETLRCYVEEKAPMKTISSFCYNRLMCDLAEEFGACVRIYNTSPDGATVALGVNWAGIGTVTAEEAAGFAGQIAKAADIAANHPAVGARIVYATDRLEERLM